MKSGGSDSKEQTKEREFERIARQAREFREEEAKRIAAEKVEVELRLQLQKQAELDRVAQASGDFLGQTALERKQQLLQQETFPGPHTDIRASHTVAERAERLQRLQEEAEARRLEEEEWRRQQHLQSGKETDTAKLYPKAPTESQFDSVHVEGEKELNDDVNQISSKERQLRRVHDILPHMEVSLIQQTIKDRTSLHVLRNQIKETTERYSSHDEHLESSSTRIAHMLEEAEVQLHRSEDELEERYTKVEEDLEKVDTALQPNTTQPGSHRGNPEIDDAAVREVQNFPSEARKSFIEKIVHDAELKFLQSQDELDEQFAKLDEELAFADLHLRKSSDSSCEKDVAREETSARLLETELRVTRVRLKDQIDSMADGKNDTEKGSTRSEYRAMPDNPYPVRVADDYASEMLSASRTSGKISLQIAESRNADFNDFDRISEAVEAEKSESLRRTRAMLAEDDLVPSGTNTDEDFGEGDRSYKFPLNGTKKGSLIVSRVPTSAMPRRDNKSKNRDDKEGETEEIVHKEASFEVPIEVTADGFKLSPKVAELAMMTTIPASRLGGRWSGSLEGNSSFGDINSASGSVSLEYKASRNSRVTVGMIRGCAHQHPLITVGGRLLRYGSSLGVTFYHNSASMHQMIVEQSMWSLSFRHSFESSKWSISSQLSRRKDFSISLSNTKLSGRVGWNWRKPENFHLRFDARPKLSIYRKAHLYCQWKAGVWQFGVSLIQSLHSQVSTVGLGWRLFSARGFEWVISWNRGNATVRVPITISKGMASANVGQLLYFSVISYLIQDCLAEMWGWIGDNLPSTEASSKSVLSIDSAKTKRDASIQKELMARQARRKAKEEAEKDGLIILEATYGVQGGDECEVSIPLQFWVSRSTLFLPGRPKSELLGFYDVTASLKKGMASTTAKHGRSFSWISIWNDLFDLKSKETLLQNGSSKVPTPTLTILYKMKGRLYRITVSDRSQLTLPDPQAELVNQD